MKIEIELEVLKISCLILFKKPQHLQLIKIRTNISKIFEETCGPASANLDRIRTLAAQRKYLNIQLIKDVNLK